MPLKVLNLNKNKITDLGALYLARMLKLNDGLLFFYIAWNNIQKRGATAIARKLSTNERLQIFDFSFNNFGSKTRFLPGQSIETNYAEAFADLFAANKTLLHVDLSHNNIGSDDCAKIAKGLNRNHTMFGLHMVGNEVDVDALGFLRAPRAHPSISHLLTRIPDEL